MLKEENKRMNLLETAGFVFPQKAAISLFNPIQQPFAQQSNTEFRLITVCSAEVSVCRVTRKSYSTNLQDLQEKSSRNGYLFR